MVIIVAKLASLLLFFLETGGWLCGTKDITRYGWGFTVAHAQL